MTEKKRSKGITITGWTEVLIGGLGGLLFFLTKIGILDPEMVMDSLVIIVLPYIPFPCPLLLFAITKMFPFLLIAGIGILGLRSWARKMNILIFSILLVIPCQCVFVLFILFIFGCSSPICSGDIHMLIGSMLPILLIILFIWYLTRPKVMEQFKN